MPRKTVKKSLTSPEKLEMVNGENMRLKEDFLEYLKSLRRSSGTLAGYDNDLNIVFTYVMERLGNKDFRKLTKRDIISIQNWLVSNGNSPARIRRIKSAMSSLSNYCENIFKSISIVEVFPEWVKTIEDKDNNIKFWRNATLW